LESVSPASLPGARLAAANLVADDGIVFGAAADDAVRPWRVDPLPAIIGEAEWAQLERGLRQRARLLDAVCQDIYGAQSILRDGVVDPAVILSHPGYLRGCPASPLLLSGADLAKGADGRWRVLADVNDNPVGIGYAMATRRVVAQVMSGLHRQFDLRRMRGFFHLLAAALTAATDKPNPLLVLFTAGIHSETAFDQGFLASLLGFALAEADDLVTQQGRIWLRAGEELEEVDVILRQVDAALADPLESHVESTVGIPGLAEACRKQALVLANPLGAGVVDNRELWPYLPDLCRRFLGEELLLESSPAGLGEDSWRVPVYEQELSERPFVLRTFGLATADGWQFLPGGLGRVGADGEPLPGLGTLAKDVWVLDEAHTGQAVSQSGVGLGRLPQARPSTAVSPRVAGTLWAIGRFAERAESKARLLKVADDIAADYAVFPGTAGHSGLLVLLRAITGITGQPISGEPSEWLRDLTLGRSATGLRHDLWRLDANAQQLRDLLSVDTWSIFARMQRNVRDADPERELQDILADVLESLLAWSGIMAQSLVHDDSWAYLDGGARLERARHTLRLLELTSSQARAPEVNEFVAEAVLRAGESLITHRRRAITGVGSAKAVESQYQLLLADPPNPRSVVNQLTALAADLELVGDLELAGWALELSDQAATREVGTLTGQDLNDLEAEISARHFSRQAARHATEEV
jgi:uncharacterized circularly permuted ATP-grasp superfamily protein/uncharacterized alpha-E superfamily protein